MRQAAAFLVLALLLAGCGRQPSGRVRPAPARAGGTAGAATASATAGGRTPQAGLSFTALRMLSGTVGWAVAAISQGGPAVRHPILRTADGGRQWVDVAPWGAGAGPGGAGLVTDFVTADQAWAAVSDIATNLVPCGSKGPSPGHPCLGPQGVARFRDAAGGEVDRFPGVTVYHTTDGGRSWTRTQVSLSGTGMAHFGPVLPQALSFAGAGHGWLMVQPQHGMNSEPGALFATADGGRTWKPIATTQGPGNGPGALPFGGRIAFSSTTTGWLAGGLVSTIDDLLYVTHDGGRSWQPVHLAVPPGHTRQQMVTAPPIFSGARGVLPVWFQGRAAAYLYVTRDGGSSWRYTRPVASSMLEALAVNDVVAMGAQTLYRSTDGGRTWTATRGGGVLPALLARRGTAINGAAFAGAEDGWLFGTEPAHAITAKRQWATTPIQPFLIVTQDGGRTWSRITPVLLPVHGRRAG